MKPAWGRFLKWSIEIALGAICVAGAAWLFRHGQPARAAQKATAPAAQPVAVAPVELHTLENIIEPLGTALAWESVDISVQVTETVISVLFDDGQTVAAGDLLVELNDAKERADRRIAELTIAEHTRERDRLAWLFEQDAIAKRDLDDRETSLALAQAALAKAEAELADREIRAPFAGVLGIRMVSLGDLVTPGAKITTLDAIDTLRVDFPVPEKYASHLSTNMTFQAVNAAWPGTLFNGAVSAIDPRVDTITRSVRVRGVIPNEDHRLKPGMLLSVRLNLGARKAPVVPETALTVLGERQSVFVLSPDGKTVARAEVKTGKRSGRWVEITEGLAPGTRIVTEGVSKVSHGAAVSVIAAGEAQP